MQPVESRAYSQKSGQDDLETKIAQRGSGAEPLIRVMGKALWSEAKHPEVTQIIFLWEKNCFSVCTQLRLPLELYCPRHYEVNQRWFVWIVVATSVFNTAAKINKIWTKQAHIVQPVRQEQLTYHKIHGNVKIHITAARFSHGCETLNH